MLGYAASCGGEGYAEVYSLRQVLVVSVYGPAKEIATLSKQMLSPGDASKTEAAGSGKLCSSDLWQRVGISDKRMLEYVCDFSSRPKTCFHGIQHTCPALSSAACGCA